MEPLVITVVSLLLYFAPSIVAFRRGKPDQWAILALNTLLGWTLIGWVICLVWALKADVGTTASTAVSSEPTGIQDNATQVEEGEPSTASIEGGKEDEIKSRRRRAQIAGAILLGVIVLFIAMSRGTGETTSSSPVSSSDSTTVPRPSPTPIPTPAAIKVTAGELLEAYDSNPIRADAQYKGKIVEVTGIVSNIDKVLGKAFISLKADRDDWGLITFQCIFKDEAVSQLIPLDEDQEVTGQTLLGGAGAKDCELVP